MTLFRQRVRQQLTRRLDEYQRTWLSGLRVDETCLDSRDAETSDKVVLVYGIYVIAYLEAGGLSGHVELILAWGAVEEFINTLPALIRRDGFGYAKTHLGLL